MVFAHNSFVLTAEDADGNPVTLLNTPVTLTLTYTDADFGLIAEESRILGRLARSCQCLVPPSGNLPGVGSKCPTWKGHSLKARCHLTEFGSFGEPSRTPRR